MQLRKAPHLLTLLSSAVLAGLLGFLMDKFGRKQFFIPLVLAAVIGTLGIYLLKFVGTGDTAALLGMLIPVGIVTMTAELSVSGLFVSSFRDYIPKGKEGCFQGIRMFLFVLLPMIIGPAIGNAIIDAYGWYSVSEITGEEILNYPYEMFLGAAIVAVFTLIPAVIVRSRDADTRARLLAERDAAANGDETAETDALCDETVQ